MNRERFGKYVVIGFFAIIVFLLVGYQYVANSDSDIHVRAPEYFGEPFSKVNSTVQGASLGRRLFNDPILSLNKNISCGSCHEQSASYANLKTRWSVGDRGEPLKTNTPVLVNLLWKESFFVDGRAKDLTQTVLNAIVDPLELNHNIEDILLRLRAVPSYTDKFKLVYGTDKIREQDFLDAIVQYLATLNSWESKYDKVQRGESVFNDEEKKGELLFSSYCAGCHQAPHFHTKELHQLATGQMIQGATLRNSGYSSPYMHDGRFDSLDSLLRLHPQKDMVSERSKQHVWSKEERRKLVAYLNTLNDAVYTNPNSY